MSPRAFEVTLIVSVREEPLVGEAVEILNVTFQECDAEGWLEEVLGATRNSLLPGWALQQRVAQLADVADPQELAAFKALFAP